MLFANEGERDKTMSIKSLAAKLAAIIAGGIILSSASAASAALIGVDYSPAGFGSTPTNWTLDTNPTSHLLTNLIDENGVATGIDLNLVTSRNSGMFDSTIPPAQIPTHTNSLAGLDGNIADDTSLTLTWSNLVPNQVYDIFVFGNDIIAENQLVTITGAGTPTVFSQNFPNDNLFVNGLLGSNAPLSTFAVPITADGAGNIQILVQNDLGLDAGLAGVAISPTALPEPGTLAILGLGLAGLGLARRKRAA